MKEVELKVKLQSCSYEELTEPQRTLIDKAKAATNGSYAPYSKFLVGAAIELEGGIIVTGANQENAAYPSGTCAERSACFSAGARYPKTPFRRIAIAAITPAGEFQASPVSPCGACRQALLEYEHIYGDIEVLLYGRDEIYVLPSVASLLPLSFTEF